MNTNYGSRARRRLRRTAPLLALAIFTTLPALFATSASANTDNWTNTSGGNFNTPGDWSSNPTVPGSGDTANFNLNNTYTVTFTNSPTNTAFTMSQGHVTWNANATVAETYALTGNSTLSGGNLTLGSSGALLTVSAANLTVNGTSTPFLTTGANSKLITANLHIGDNGIGGFSGSVLDSSNITQTGASTLTIGATSQSSGILTIGASSIFNTGTGNTTVNALGTLSLIVNATFNLNGNLSVNGGNVSVTGGGILWNNSNTAITIQSGGKVNILGNMETPTNGVISLSGAGSQLNYTGASADLQIDHGGQLSATSGAKVSSDEFFDVAFNGNGTASFDGANTSLSAGSGNNSIGQGGTGTLTFSNGASGTTGGFIIGQSNGSNGTLNVQSNAILSSGSIFVASSATTAIGTINVNSGGVLTMTAGSTLTVGATGTSLATVTIAGGTLSTSTSLTTINPTGHVYLNLGTLNLNGDLTVTAGLLNQTGGTFNWVANHSMLIQSGGNVSLLGAYATPANANITVTGAGSQLNDIGSGTADLVINTGATLSVTNGGSVHSDLFLDIASSGNGTVTVDGNGSSFSVTGGENFLGSSGTGSLTFSNSATGSVPGGFQIGSAAGSSGSLFVLSSAVLTSGPMEIADQGTSSTGFVNVTGGTLTQSGASILTVGQSAAFGGVAVLNVGTGGTFNTGTGITTIAGTGQINLNGGDFNLNGSITVTGGSFTQTGGTFTWAASQTMTIQSGGVVTLAGLYLTPANAVINITGNGSKLENTGTFAIRVVNGATVSVTSGGTLKADNSLNIGFGTVTIDGLGSSFSAAAPASSGGNVIGNSGNASTVTFSNQATGSISTGFILGLTSGSSGTLNVQSSATLTSGPLDVADSGFPVTGVVNVIGGTLTQTGTSALSVGQAAAPGGSATVTIGIGGTFNTGTGATTIGATGQIDLNGGTFNQNGDIFVTGGLLLQNSGTFTFAASHNMTIQSAGDVRLTGPFTTPTNANITITDAGSQFNDLGTSTALLAIQNGATVNVLNGGSIHSDLVLAIGAGGNGTVTVDGAGSSFTSGGSITSYLGSNGTGTLTLSNNATGSASGGFQIGGLAGSSGILNIQSNAALTTGNLYLVVSAINSTAAVNVSGGTLTQTGAASLLVGAASLSNATVTIGTGGTFTTGTGATTINATGKINLSGGTLNENADITLTGGALNETGGTFNWAAGHNMTIQSGGKVNLINTYTTPANAVITIAGSGSTFSDTGPIARLTIDNGTSVSVTGGGSLHSDQFLNIGQSANATVTVDGANSSLSSGNAQSILGNAGNGSLTFSNTSTGNIGFLQIGSQAGSTGTLNVQSNANLTLGSLSLAPNATTASGIVNVTGGTITQTGASTLTLGAASASSATLNIGNTTTGAIFTTGTGLTTINATGKLNLNEGTFNLNGGLTVTGGAFTQTGGSFNWANNKTMTVQSAGNVTLFSQFVAPPNAVINVSGAGSQLNDLISGDLVINAGASLTVTNGGTVYSDHFLDIGSNSGNAAVTVDGANSSFTTGAQPSLLGIGGNGSLTFSNGSIGNLAGYDIGSFFGNAGNGSLNVLSNATVTATGAMNVGTFANVGTAFVNVTGGTLTQTNNSTLTIGATANAIASVNVGVAGTYNTSAALTTINPTGQLNINGGTLNLNGDLTVTGGSLSQISGNFHWASGHNMTIQSGGIVSLSGTYLTPANSNTTVTGANSVLLVPGASAELGIDFGASLSITSGGAAHSGQFLSIADTGNGNVTVDGANSSLSAAVSAANGTNTLGTGGTGSLTFSNNATGSLPGGLEIGFNPGSIGILNVNSNASLTTGTITLADSGLSTIGIVNVTGGSLTQSTASSLIVGDISGNNAGAATLTIGLFGTLSTGTGNINIARTGTLNDQPGGNFLISGNVTNAGNLIFAGNHAWAPTTKLTNTAGKTTFSSNGKLYGLSITGGTVDITSAKLIIEAATNKSAALAALQADIANHSLTSSTLPANFGLALVDNAVLATHFTFFGGNPVDLNALLLAPELLGDTNIDGHVDLTDLNTVLNHLGATTANWTDGNFDGAPTIDLTDLNDVLNNLGVSNPNNATVLAAENLLQAAASNVPEPGSLAMLGAGIAALIMRRRHAKVPAI